ncbi:AMP-binding protein [Candidatus Poriferisodalis sp.]|uniref:AMP-binding protein n=1 Tax=Candidatus Poriferisodalis sp. TaxID=3101277 RepID=UPI003B017CB7
MMRLDSTTESAHIDRFVLDGLPPADQWPEITLSEPLFSYPSRLNAATVLLDGAISQGRGQRPCMGLGDDMWTYSDVYDCANRIAAVLAEDFGIVPGNRVLLRGANAPWMVAAWFAVLKAGAVAVTTMPLLRAQELAKVCAKCAPAVSLCAEGLEAALRKATDCPIAIWGPAGDLEAAAATKSGKFTAIDTAATDPALLACTSGTTGVPKVAAHFHRDLLVIADAFAPLLQARPDDLFVGSPPLAFTFGLGGEVVFPMRVGACTWFCDEPGPEALANLIAERRATVCFSSPTAYRAMLALKPRPDLSSLRRAVSAGEWLPRATFELVEAALGLKLIDGIGSTELLHIFISASDDDIRPGATGKPLPGWEAAIFDDDGNPMPPGEPGRLAVKGPIGCRYLNDARQSTYVRNGWNITGDIYACDFDGYFWYQARADDMIVSSGYNIAAPEVEEALLSHTAVAEAGVIGSPDPDRGMIVHAFVHLRDPSTATEALARELGDHVKASIAPYKYPRRITFCAEPLPKTTTGKLQRRELSKLTELAEQAGA